MVRDPSFATRLTESWRSAVASRGPNRLCLSGVAPDLPPSRLRDVLVDEPERTPSTELDCPQAPGAAENARDPSTRPTDRILHIRKSPRRIGRQGESVEQLPHEIAAAVVKPRDLTGIPHRVLGAVLSE